MQVNEQAEEEVPNTAERSEATPTPDATPKSLPVEEIKKPEPNLKRRFTLEAEAILG